MATVLPAPGAVPDRCAAVPSAHPDILTQHKLHKIAHLQPGCKACETLARCPSGGWPVLVAKDLLCSQWPVPEHPGEAAMAQFAGKCGRRDGQNRALA